MDDAGVLCQTSGKDGHERRLARPVLTQQRLDTARDDVQRDVVIRPHGAEALADALKTHHGCHIVTKGPAGTPRLRGRGIRMGCGVIRIRYCHGVSPWARC